MMLDNYECGGFTFNANFDSGNLGRVELVTTRNNNGIKDGETNCDGEKMKIFFK